MGESRGPESPFFDHQNGPKTPSVGNNGSETPQN